MTGGLDALFPTLRHKKLQPLQIITGSGGLGITSFRWFVDLFSIHVKSKLSRLCSKKNIKGSPVL